MNAWPWIACALLLGQTGEEAEVDEPRVKLERRAPANIETPEDDLAEQPSEEDPAAAGENDAPSSAVDLGDDADDSAAIDEPPARAADALPDDSRSTLPRDDDQSLQSVRPPTPRVRAPELLADALVRSVELRGKPVCLAEALSSSSIREEQWQRLQAYWRLSAAQALYFFAEDEENLLAQLVQTLDTAEIHSALASAKAARHEARLHLTLQQQALADRLGWSGNDPPLAADRPHAGGFNTRFADLFAQRGAPPRLKLIDRTLPIRRQAVDAHAAAVTAAQDAWQSTTRGMKAGESASTILYSLDMLVRQRRAFIQAVRDYNVLYGEYALNVAPQGNDGFKLAQILIKSPLRPEELDAPQPSAAGDDDDVSGRDSRAPSAETTAPSPPPAESTDSPDEDADSGARRSPKADPFGQTSAVTAGKLVAGGSLYSALVPLSADAGARELAKLLYWDRTTAADSVRPASLQECLAAAGRNERHRIRSLYLQTQQRAAQYQALNDALEQLNSAHQMALAARHEPGAAEAMLRLRTLTLATRAERFLTQASLVEWQYELTRAVRKNVDGPWLWPATAPSTDLPAAPGSNREGQSAAGASPLRERHAALQQGARAVILADAARGAISTAGGDVDRLAVAIDRQIGATRGFLYSVAVYNMAIPDNGAARPSMEHSP